MCPSYKVAAPIKKIAFRWCSLDRVVYIKAMRMLLKRLQLEVDGEQNETIDVCIEGAPGGGKSNMMANVIKYCVSTQPVSMHIPLCRLLAGKTYIIFCFILSTCPRLLATYVFYV